MANETQLTVVGRLTADPELRYTQSGIPVASATVASNARTFDKASGEWKDGEPLFLNFSVWREHGEHVAASLRKGDHVIVVGSLEQRSYEKKDGTKGTSYEVRVDQIGPALQFARCTVARVIRDTPAADHTADSLDGFVPAVA